MHVEAFILLFAVASAVALAARAVRVPYTVALVLAGLGLGRLQVMAPVELNHDTLFGFFLPALIFEAAFHLDARGFWRDRLTINAMATPGLILATGLTALILVPVVSALGFVADFQWLHGLVFAAVIAATDPVSVVALFKSLGAPRRLAVIVEGESLLNDGTGVVVFMLAAAAAAGTLRSPLQAAVEFVRIAGLGAVLGAAVGCVSSQLTRRIDDAMVEVTLTVITAYGAFTLAERLHASGVIATVAAGMLCGNYGAQTAMSPTTRIAVETFWEYAAFALNSIVFLLIGMEVEPAALLAAWRPIAVAYVATLAARAVVVYLVTGLLQRTSSRLPWSWSAVITWSGLRGALSMVLVLGLPQEFPHRLLLVDMTYGVVLLSILLQGLTMSPLLRGFGLLDEPDGRAPSTPFTGRRPLH